MRADARPSDATTRKARRHCPVLVTPSRRSEGFPSGPPARDRAPRRRPHAERAAGARPLPRPACGGSRAGDAPTRVSPDEGRAAGAPPSPPPPRGGRGGGAAGGGAAPPGPPPPPAGGPPPPGGRARGGRGGPGRRGPPPPATPEGGPRGRARRGTARPPPLRPPVRVREGREGAATFAGPRPACRPGTPSAHRPSPADRERPARTTR